MLSADEISIGRVKRKKKTNLKWSNAFSSISISQSGVKYRDAEAEAFPQVSCFGIHGWVLATSKINNILVEAEAWKRKRL